MIDTKEAVKAYYLKTRSYKKTAEKFGLKPDTVKTRASRGKWAAIPADEAKLLIERVASAEAVPERPDTAKSQLERVADILSATAMLLRELAASSNN